MPPIDGPLTQGYIRYVATRNKKFLENCTLVKLQILELGKTSLEDRNGYVQTPVLLTDGIYYIQGEWLSLPPTQDRVYLSKYEVIQIDGGDIDWNGREPKLCFAWWESIETPGKVLGRDIMEHLKHSKSQVLRVGRPSLHTVPF